jgi:hypothetical protein
MCCASDLHSSLDHMHSLLEPAHESMSHSSRSQAIRIHWEQFQALIEMIESLWSLLTLLVPLDQSNAAPSRSIFRIKFQALSTIFDGLWILPPLEMKISSGDAKGSVVTIRESIIHCHRKGQGGQRGGRTGGRGGGHTLNLILELLLIALLLKFLKFIASVRDLTEFGSPDQDPVGLLEAVHDILIVVHQGDRTPS